MNPILVALAANALLATAAHAGSFEGEDHTNATLLISTSEQDMRAAANALARHATTNPAMLDLAANMLWLGCKGQRGIPADAQVALGAALGQSGHMRYRDVLTYCADRALHQDVKDGTEEALALLPSDNTNNEIQFVGGSIRLYDVSTQLAASVSRDAAKRPARVLAEVAAGQPIEAVYQRVGLPDSVAAEGDGIIAHYGTGAVPFIPAKEGWRIAGANVAAAPQAPRPHPPAPKAPIATAPPVIAPAPKAPVAAAMPTPTAKPAVAPPPPAPAPTPAPKPSVATPPPTPTPAPSVASAAPQSPPKPAPPAPKAATPVPKPPAPVVAPSPPPVQAAPTAPANVASANTQFTVGQVVHLRSGGYVRLRPLTEGVLGVPVTEPMRLKATMANASGTWWFVDYGTNKSGWVLESDLAP